jgi:hypothetical protein
MSASEINVRLASALDTFFWRLGDLAQVGVVLAGTFVALSTTRSLLVTVGIYLEHRKLAQS